MKKFQINPILRKELTLGSRTLKFPFALMGYALVLTFNAITILGASVFTFDIYNYNKIDYQMLTISFMMLVFLQAGLLCIIVPILTAGTIAGERERQTLDIMLTAPITPLSIVLGKLGASLLKVLLFIFCSLPSLSVCFLYGGIKWQYLIVFVVEMLALAFLIGAIGIWCSCVFRKTIAAVIMTLVFEAAFYVGPIMIMIAGCLLDYLVEGAIVGFYQITELHIGILPLVLLLCPIFGFVDSIVASNTGYSIASFVCSGMDGLFNPTLVLQWVSNIWPWISVLTTIGIGMFFVWMAAREIDRIRRKGLRPSKKKKEK